MVPPAQFRRRNLGRTYYSYSGPRHKPNPHCGLEAVLGGWSISITDYSWYVQSTRVPSVPLRFCNVRYGIVLPTYAATDLFLADLSLFDKVKKIDGTDCCQVLNFVLRVPTLGALYPKVGNLSYWFLLASMGFFYVTRELAREAHRRLI